MGDIYWASVKDLDDENIYLTKTIDKVTHKALENKKTKFLPKGNVVVCTRMGLGIINLNKVDITINQDLKAIILPNSISQLFFYYTYLTMDIVGSGMTVSGIKQNDLINLPFQFPPLTEQYRIVQKIESLFEEVDELEENLNRQSKMDEKLQLAVNAEVQQAPDAEASKTAWQFISSNFETLYHTPEAIDNLKKNILNEAVRGRLAPQDSNDEPASELLKKLETERDRLYEAGEIRKPKVLPPITEDEIPFEIPKSWAWVQTNTIFETVRGGSPRPAGDPEFYDGEIPFLKVGDLTNDEEVYVQDDSTTIKEAGLKKTRQVGDGIVLLTNSGATLGAPKITRFETTFNDGIAAFLPYGENIFNEYFYWFLKGKKDWFRDYVNISLN